MRPNPPLRPPRRRLQSVTLRMAWYNDGNEGEVMRALLDRYEKENPGIKVVMDTVAYADLDKTLQPQAEAGTPPDLARVTDLALYTKYLLDMTPLPEGCRRLGKELVAAIPAGAAPRR